MLIGRMSHPNPIIDKKVKFFSDHFHYILSKNTDSLCYPLENHLLILERLLEKSTKLEHPTSKKTFDFYVNQHPLFNTTRDLFSRKGRVKSNLIKIRRLLKGLHQEFNYIQTQQEINTTIIAIMEELDKNNSEYIKHCINALARDLSCSCNVKEKEKSIKYFSALIAAEFIRLQFTVKDIISGNSSLFNRILSKKINYNVDGDNSSIYSHFPLPERIEELRDQEDFNVIINDFLENRTFEEQFEGIFDFLSIKRTGDFLFKIERVSIPKEGFFVETDGVKIVSSNHVNPSIKYWDKRFREEFDEFCKTDNCVFALVSLTFRSKEAGYKAALRKIKEVKRILNYRFGKGGIINLSRYYILYPKGATTSWARDELSLSQTSIDEYDKSYFGFKEETLKPELNKDLLSVRSIYFKAFSSDFNEDQVLYIWLYFESVIRHYIPANHDGEKVIKKVVQVLMLHEFTNEEKRLQRVIIEVVANGSSKLLNSSKTNLELRSLAYKNSKDFNISDFKEYFDYKFLNDRVDEYGYLETDKSNYLTSKEKYYKRLFWELYEQRNLLIHRGKYCQSTVEKLTRLFPVITRRFRDIINNEIESNNYTNMSEVIKKLLQDYSTKIAPLLN